MTNIEFINEIFFNNEIKVDEGTLLVDLYIEKEETIKFLNELESILVIDSYFENQNEIFSLDNKYLNKKISIQFNKSYLRSELEFDCFSDFDDFLKLNRTKKVSKSFYILSHNYSSLSSEKLIKELENYEIILKLFRILDKIKVNKEKNGYFDYEYTIFDKRKITIDSFYDELSINKLFENDNVETIIKELYSEVITDLDRRVNGIFFINAIEDIFKKKKKFKFKDLLENFFEVYYEYQVHHRAYVNTLDLGKMKLEAEKILKEDFSKVNDFIRDINSKIIFLPIAFIAILTQLDSTNSTSKNIFIGMCMFIFSLIVQKFTTMQSEMLNSLSEEIEDNEKEYKKTENLYILLERKIIRVKNLISVLNDRFEWTINLNWILFFIVLTLVIGYQLKVIA